MKKAGSSSKERFSKYLTGGPFKRNRSLPGPPLSGSMFLGGSAFCLDVRTLTFCQPMGFPFSFSLEVKKIAEQKATE